MEEILRNFESGSIESLIETAQVTISFVEDREDRLAMINELRSNISHTRAKMEDDVTQMFIEVDANGDGFLDKDELTEKLNSMGKVELMGELFSKMDTDGDGRLSRDEFTSFFNKILDQGVEMLDKSETELMQEPDKSEADEEEEEEEKKEEPAE